MKGWVVLGAVVFLVLLCLTVMWQRDSVRPTVPEPKIGVVLKAMDSEYWLSVRSSMEKTARENNMRVIVMTPEAESDVETQEVIVRDLLDIDIDALVVSLVDVDRAQEIIAMAEAKRVPLFTIDEKVPGIPYIGSDNYRIGEMAAEHLSAVLPNGAEVAVLAGSPNQDAHRKRIAGFRDYIEKKTDFRLVEVMADATKYRQATVQTEHMLESHPHLRALFVTSAIMALGTVDTARLRDPGLVIVGVDTQNDALLALRNRYLSAMVSQDGNETGRLAIRVVQRYLQGDAVEADAYIRNELITPETAEHALLQEDF